MIEKLGGAEGARTPDLRIANATLSQLSYGPTEPRGRGALGKTFAREVGFRARPNKGAEIGFGRRDNEETPSCCQAGSGLGRVPRMPHLGPGTVPPRTACLTPAPSLG